MAANWASSEEVSCRSKMSPFFTDIPPSKYISTTLPGNSAATVTPRTAFNVPTEVRAVSHDSAFTTADVTVSGGGTKFLA